jgi:hypothetical protein
MDNKLSGLKNYIDEKTDLFYHKTEVKKFLLLKFEGMI